MQIKDDLSLKWLEKMKGDPNKCNKNKYCRFHKDHGHDTDECYDLKQQIKKLIDKESWDIMFEGIIKMKIWKEK